MIDAQDVVYLGSNVLWMLSMLHGWLEFVLVQRVHIPSHCLGGMMTMCVFKVYSNIAKIDFHWFVLG